MIEYKKNISLTTSKFQFVAIGTANFFENRSMYNIFIVKMNFE